MKQGKSDMSRKSILAAVVGLQLIVAAPVTAGPTSEYVAHMADVLQFKVGKQEDTPFTIVSIKADRDVLVLRVDGPKGWRRDRKAEELSGLFITAFCEDGAELFDEEVKIRVETTEDGGSGLMVDPTADYCPA
jgi:hypothetical protein